jgi:aspartyl-tRNA(Asn)/glutamyl-tRNA(Gln) amidotransferase subunit A
MNPEELPLTELASAIRTGALSPVEYVHSLFARMDQVESRVEAWVTVDRDAVLTAAVECEKDARNGSFRGALHGIPIGVKDIFYTKGLRTTMGSPVFADFVPDHDAAAVTRLRQAGAIILGKTVTTMFALLDPGPTRNPWNLGHTPGGSSSGSAAAVAARMCPVAIGSQTIGSVGRPAAFNGLVSLVPTQSRISRTSVFPLAWSLDHVGIFGRFIADVELMLNAMTESAVEKSPAKRIFRVGLIRDFFHENATPDARLLNERLANQLAESRFQVDEAHLPPIFEMAQPILRTMLRAEAASVHESLFKAHSETYAPRIRTVVETGMLVPATDYLRASRLRRRYQQEMARLFGQFDVLMTPAARGGAPEGLGSTGDPVMNGPWTLADFPALTLPAGLDGKGMPLGIQLSGPPFQEGLLLEIAKIIESMAGFNAKPTL